VYYSAGVAGLAEFGAVAVPCNGAFPPTPGLADCPSQIRRMKSGHCRRRSDAARSPGASESKLVEPPLNAEIVSACPEHRCSSQNRSDLPGGKGK
jgi:hypothetical protein